VGDACKVSVSRPESVQQLDTVEQSVHIVRRAFRGEGQSVKVRMLDRGFRALHSALDPWELRRVAIRISIRDDLPAVPLRDHARELAEETYVTRMGRVRVFIRGEYLCDVVVSLVGVYEVVVSGRWLMVGSQWPVVSSPKKSDD
jgi:hypothetical protein